MNLRAFAVCFALVPITACGARTELGGVLTSDAAADACNMAQLCRDNARGTWRFETPDHAASYLFTFDGSSTCNGTADAFLLVVGDSQCSRNGDYQISDDTASHYAFAASNLGGSFGAPCGGDPNGETMQIDLTRNACDAATYTLTVHDSAPSSPYELTATASRCRCDIGWVPCVDPLPKDPCAP